MNNPLITVITVSYNAVDSIETTILSVLNQSYAFIEYIIIDGGSNDGTVGVIEKYADKISYWVSEPDRGIYDAMNKGISHASGVYCNFMNAGDSFYSFDIVKSIFSVKRDADVIYGDNVLQYDWGKIVLAPDNIVNMDKYMTFGHQTSFTKIILLKKFGFDCSFKISADYNLFYNLYINKYKFEYIPFSISLFEASGGVSNNYPVITFKEDAIITRRVKRPLWEVHYFILKCRVLIFRTLKKMFPKSLRRKMEKSRVCKNTLIKEICLK